MEEFEKLITDLPAYIGRDGGEKELRDPGKWNKQDGCFVGLGDHKSLSRVHASIQWDFVKGTYRIDCMSEY